MEQQEQQTNQYAENYNKYDFYAIANMWFFII